MSSPCLQNSPPQHLCLACSCPYMSVFLFLIACFPLLPTPTVPFNPLHLSRPFLSSWLGLLSQVAPKNSEQRYAKREGGSMVARVIFGIVPTLKFHPPPSPFTFPKHMEVLVVEYSRWIKQPLIVEDNHTAFKTWDDTNKPLDLNTDQGQTTHFLFYGLNEIVSTFIHWKVIYWRLWHSVNY